MQLIDDITTWLMTPVPPTDNDDDENDDNDNDNYNDVTIKNEPLHSIKTPKKSNRKRE